MQNYQTHLDELKCTPLYRNIHTIVQLCQHKCIQVINCDCGRVEFWEYLYAKGSGDSVYLQFTFNALQIAHYRVCTLADYIQYSLYNRLLKVSFKDFNFALYLQIMPTFYSDSTEYLHTSIALYLSLN